MKLLVKKKWGGFLRKIPSIVINGFKILPKDEKYPNRTKQIKRVNQQKNDYQKLKNYQQYIKMATEYP